MKTCTNCKEEKDIDCFHKVKRAADGYNWECKKCCAVKKRISRYGVSAEEALFLMSIKHCEICNDEIKGRRANIDHCHKTGKVRGVLCHYCNIAIGCIENSSTNGMLLDAFINKHK